MGKHEGKVALITGGTSGIGLATAARLVHEGAYVFITGRRKDELDEALKRIAKNVTGVQGDVAKLEDLDRLYAVIKKEKGHLDILFANAGIYENMPLGQITEAHFDKAFDINVRGLLFTVQKALPLLVDGASIILNASFVGSVGRPALSVYSATKAAVRSFARTFSVDLKDRKIRVNAISPGVVPTAGFSTGLGMDAHEVDAYARGAASHTPLGRVGTPDEIASVVSFLASDDASFVDGSELLIDGGIAQSPVLQ
jgi:NAD(P)-dependent dehydrogenase (short-subunit alcohol dehydrogenase family)